MDDPSAPCLVYLFADRLLAKEGHWDHAMGEIAVPVPGTLVKLGELGELGERRPTVVPQTRVAVGLQDCPMA